MKTPELVKLSEVRERSQTVGEFVDWLRDEKNVTLCESHQHSEFCENSDEDIECELEDNEYVPFSFRMEELLARYFDIDLDKAENERRKLLESLRTENAK